MQKRRKVAEYKKNPVLLHSERYVTVKILCLTFLEVEMVTELESTKDKIQQMERGKADLEEKFKNCQKKNDKSQQEQSASFGIDNFWSLISTKSN